MSSGGHLRGWREEYMRGVGVRRACRGIKFKECRVIDYEANAGG